MDIRFYNTHNLVIPVLDFLLIKLNAKGIKSEAYISNWDYRKTNRSRAAEKYFVKSMPTRLFSFNKRTNQMAYFVIACLKVFFTKPRLNIFFTQPPLMVIFAAGLSRARGVKYGIHLMDLYPDMLGALGYWSKNGFIYRLLDSWMTAALKKASFVTILGEGMNDYLKEKGVDENKMVKVINVPSISKPAQRDDELLKSLGIAEKFTILYAGNMGIAHEFSTILEVSLSLQKSHPDIEFVFLGKGHRRKEIEQFLEAKQSGNIRLLNSLDDNAFSQVLAFSDIHFISLRDAFLGLLMPSKFYSSVATGRPVLFEGSKSCEIAIEIEKHELGLQVDHLDSSGLRSAIISLYENKERRSQLASNALNYSHQHCNPDQVIASYCQYLQRHL